MMTNPPVRASIATVKLFRRVHALGLTPWGPAHGRPSPMCELRGFIASRSACRPPLLRNVCCGMGARKVLPAEVHSLTATVASTRRSGAGLCLAKQVTPMGGNDEKQSSHRNENPCHDHPEPLPLAPGEPSNCSPNPCDQQKQKCDLGNRDACFVRERKNKHHAHYLPTGRRFQSIRQNQTSPGSHPWAKSRPPERVVAFCMRSSGMATIPDSNT